MNLQLSLAFVLLFLYVVTLSDLPCYDIYGLRGCYYFEQARNKAQELQGKGMIEKVNVHDYDRAGWNARLSKLNEQNGTKHRTSPYILEGCNGQKTFVGGNDSFQSAVRNLKPVKNERSGL